MHGSKIYAPANSDPFQNSFAGAEEGATSSFGHFLSEEVSFTTMTTASEDQTPKVIDDDSEEVDQSSSLKKETGEVRNLTYKEMAKKNGINYTVTELPPVGTSILLGLQHYLTMLGATVLIPLIVCPAMGANDLETAEVISSIFFVSGITTLIQTTIGDR